MKWGLADIIGTRKHYIELLSHFILGTSNDSWTGGSIVSQLNPDILVKIQHCFMVRLNAK